MQLQGCGYEGGALTIFCRSLVEVHYLFWIIFTTQVQINQYILIKQSNETCTTILICTFGDTLCTIQVLNVAFVESKFKKMQ